MGPKPTIVTGKRAWLNVFLLTGTLFALLSLAMYWIKGGSIQFAIGLGYGIGAVMATVYYVRHRNQFPAKIAGET